MSTAIWIAGPVVVCGWFIAAFINCFITNDVEEEQ